MPPRTASQYWSYPCTKCHSPAFFMKDKPKPGMTVSLNQLLVLKTSKWQTPARLCCQFCGKDPRPDGSQKIDTKLMEIVDVHAVVHRMKKENDEDS